MHSAQTLSQGRLFHLGGEPLRPGQVLFAMGFLWSEDALVLLHCPSHRPGFPLGWSSGPPRPCRVPLGGWGLDFSSLDLKELLFRVSVQFPCCHHFSGFELRKPCPHSLDIPFLRYTASASRKSTPLQWCHPLRSCLLWIV
jgi:hypothetical protein